MRCGTVPSKTIVLHNGQGGVSARKVFANLSAGVSAVVLAVVLGEASVVVLVVVPAELQLEVAGRLWVMSWGLWGMFSS